MGLPDVIAHGMFTLALAARYVDEQLGNQAASSSSAPSSPSPSSSPREVPRSRSPAPGATNAPSRSASPVPARACSAIRWRSCVPELPELLSDHTTLRLGGPARTWLRAETEQDLVDAVRTCDEAGEPVLVLAGGSNVVVADDGFAGTVVEVATTGVAADHEGDDPTCGGVLVTVAAGESGRRSWRRRRPRLGRGRGVVRHPRLGRRDADPERRRLRPGGVTDDRPVRVWDRHLRGVRTFAAADCGFGYRTSRFKADPGRHVVLAVTFQFRRVSSRAGDVRRAGPRPRRRAGRAGADDRRTPRGAGAARPQGHGAGRGGPRHLERRVVLHQPRARRARRCPKARRPGPRPTGG